MVRPPYRRRRSCLSPFALAILVVTFSCACLAASAFGLRQSIDELSRTNILILGLDRRPEQGYAVRSDVLMLVTAYPPASHLAVISIPRDLYVDIPRHGSGRINAAHFWGESERERGGPALAMETVASSFGVPVHGYVRLDFDGFRAIVDGVGGIDVVVEEPIVDDAYPTPDYGTMRIEIPAGLQHMDGETALRYVRSRHGSSDFERAARQQQVLIALAGRLADPGSWPRLPAVCWALMENVDGSLGVRGLIQLAIAGLRVGPDGIEHYVIDRDMTRPWTTPTGGAVLLPRWEAIGPLVEDVLGR
jgi:LCP family protein required for cell wall assembly